MLFRSEIPSVPEQLGDVWDSSEIAKLPITATQPSELTQSIELRADTQLSIDDNWSILLDEIIQDSEPEVKVEPETAPILTDDLKIAPLLRVEAEIKAEITKLQTTQLQLSQQIEIGRAHV